jgi:hypothetical protein
MTREQKLHRWAQRELTLHLNDLILDDWQGGILAFGRYEIQSSDQEFVVTRDNELQGKFTTRRVALSWCVADNKHIWDLRQRIAVLDQQRHRLNQDINTRKQAQSRIQDGFRKNLVEDKLQNRHYQLANTNFELEKCLARAKYLQLRGSQNETARTRTA